MARGNELVGRLSQAVAERAVPRFCTPHPPPHGASTTSGVPPGTQTEMPTIKGRRGGGIPLGGSHTSCGDHGVLSHEPCETGVCSR